MSFISESAASLKPKYLRARPMRAPFRPLGSRKRVESVAIFPLAAAVTLSRRSTPAKAPRRIAASRTVRAIGPGVSWLWAIGITPDRLMRPRVGLMPTSPFADEGQTTEPSVSVPTAAAQRFAPVAAPEPELEPQGLRSRA